MTLKELYKWRIKHNLTQSKLAEKLGITKACISRWESGNRPISPFLHLALECLKAKKGGEPLKIKGIKTKKKRG